MSCCVGPAESERAAFVKRAGVDKVSAAGGRLLLVVHGGAEGFLETPALDVVARAVGRADQARNARWWA